MSEQKTDPSKAANAVKNHTVEDRNDAAAAQYDPEATVLNPSIKEYSDETVARDDAITIQNPAADKSNDAEATLADAEVTVPNPALGSDDEAAIRNPAATEGNAGLQQQAVVIASLQDQLADAQQQAQEHLDKALRAKAELENLRKRTVREVENAHKYGLERFVSELLPVIDSIELGISAAQTTAKATELKEGMDLTLKMLDNALEKFNVVVVQPAAGDKFNPEQHEAVATKKTDETEADNSVVDVMQKGYALNGRIIRPARVVVATAK